MSKFTFHAVDLDEVDEPEADDDGRPAGVESAADWQARLDASSEW